MMISVCHSALAQTDDDDMSDVIDAVRDVIDAISSFHRAR